MCTETLDRTEYEPKARGRGDACDRSFSQVNGVHLTTSDRVRLGVVVSSGVEMYSWAGANRFNHRDLSEMVDGGAISTGSLADLLTVVFRSDDANFTYNGETTLKGRTLSEFGFQVPLEGSHYWYGGRITGYSGTVLVDAKSGELVRLVVRTTRLPKESKACYASTTLDYARARLRGADFLVPAAAHLQVLNADGGEAENRTAFAGCREFSHPADVALDSPAVPSADVRRGADERQGAAPQAVVFPPGVEFRVVLTQGINTATAASGDLVKAALVTPIMEDSKVLASPGAVVAARIVRIRRMYGAHPRLLLDIKLETVDVAGVPVSLTAAPLLVRFPAVNGRPAEMRPRTAGFSPACVRGTFVPCPNLLMRENLGTGRGAFQFIFENIPHDPYLIPSGLESKWMTGLPE